jgi:hypothetical protein
VDATDTVATDPADTETTSTGTGEPSGDASSSTTMEPPIPFCGDGNVDPGEECDPADAAPDAPPCNTLCTFSGRLLQDFNWEHEGNDVGLAVVPWDGDIAVAGYAEWADELQSTDIHVSLHGPDLDELWPMPFRYSGSAGMGDNARGLAVTADGMLRVVGHVRPTEKMTHRDQIWMADLAADGTLVWEASFGTAEVIDQATAIVLIDATEFAITGRIGNASNDFVVQRYSTAMGTPPTLVWSAHVDGAGMETDLGYAIASGTGLLFAGGSWRVTATDLDRYLASWALDGTPTPEPCDVGYRLRAPDGADEIRGVAVRQDGSLVAVGFSQPGTNQDAWLGVYRAGDCELQWQRSVDGGFQGADRAAAVAVDEQGDIYTAGWVHNGSNDDTWLVKWDGAAVGEVVWEAEPVNGPGDGTDRIHAIAIDANGTLVVAGQISQPDDSDVWIARYTP